MILSPLHIRKLVSLGNWAHIELSSCLDVRISLILLDNTHILGKVKTFSSLDRRKLVSLGYWTQIELSSWGCYSET